MFYNTGIATYIWVLTNRKPEHRRGMVQLIDATTWFEPLRKNLGKKNSRFSAADMRRVIDSFSMLKRVGNQKSFQMPRGYWKVTVERSLRLRVDLSDNACARFRRACQQVHDVPLADLIDRVAAAFGAGSHHDYNAFLDALELHAQGIKLIMKRQKLIQATLTERDQAAALVIKNYTRGDKADRLYGRFAVNFDGKPDTVEYEPDTELRDTEQVPLLEPGGIAAVFQRGLL